MDTDSFWCLSQNKVSFQHFFIKWMLETRTKWTTYNLGGANEDDQTACIHLKNGSAEKEALLKCSLEKADDRIFCHISHGVKMGKIRSVIIASPHTDVFVCSLFHYRKLLCFGLQDFWVISRKQNAITIVPVHELVKGFDAAGIGVLPAVHVLTGCDTTSKVGTKLKALKTATSDCDLLKTFGKDPINDQKIADAEQFLVKCISSSKCVHKCFDVVSHETFCDKKFAFDLEKLPPTRTSIRQHILRAFLQCEMWLKAPSGENSTLDPAQYGYNFNANGHAIPDIINGSPFPVPCNCLKCSRDMVCVHVEFEIFHAANSANARKNQTAKIL